MIQELNEHLWRAQEVRPGLEHISVDFSIVPHRRDHHDVIREVWNEDVYQMESLEFDGRVVVDIGAHIGAVTCRAAALGAHVIAIEPFPEAFELLQRNVESNGLADRVTLINGLFDIAGEDRRFIRRDGETGMGLSGSEDADGAIEVERIFPSAILSEIGIDNLALLKIDIEGWEHALFAPPVDSQMMALVSMAERVTMETHPGSNLGSILESLIRTHSISAFGHPEVGGHIHAYRYPA